MSRSKKFEELKFRFGYPNLKVCSASHIQIIDTILSNYRHDFALKDFDKFKILVCQI